MGGASREKGQGRSVIVLNKDPIAMAIDDWGRPTHMTYSFKGTPILGKMQLLEIIEHEAEQSIRGKYLAREAKRILEDINIVGLKPRDLERVLQYVKFKKKNPKECKS